MGIINSFKTLFQYTTSSLTGTLLSTRTCSDTSRARASPLSTRSSRRPTPTPSTGLRLVPSPVLRIRVSAVPAGLSPPLVPSRVPTSLPLESFFPSLSSSSLIAPTSDTDMATWAAMVVSRLMPITTTTPTLLSLSQPTHTPPVLAKLEAASATSVSVASYVNVTPSNKAQMKAALDQQP